MILRHPLFRTIYFQTAPCFIVHSKSLVLRMSKSTVSVAGITKEPFSIPTTSVFIDIIVEKQMSVERSFSVGSNAFPVRPAMSAMTVINHSINAPSPTNMCTMHALLNAKYRTTWYPTWSISNSHFSNGEKCFRIFYYEPMRSGQNGDVENAHTLPRMILPKGTDFDSPNIYFRSLLSIMPYVIMNTENKGFHHADISQHQ